ncbi:MAG TPA: SDR family oxidoreductase [Iamia sp.]|nr:SDR family oxidoreductase [Iamia sp.]
MNDPVPGRFAGQVAIVTGSSRGIGRAVATRLVAEGARVVLNGRSTDSLASVASSLGAQAVAVPGSVSDPAVPGALVDAAVSSFGRIDVVVNNAATSAHYGPLLDADRSRFEKTMVANTWPAVEIVQRAVAAGLGTGDGGGAVVNVSTTGATRVHPVTGPYTASKAALEMLTQLLARELGHRGIRVNAVAPGLVRTDLARVLWEGDRGASEAELVPLLRLGEVDDIASAVCYLASGDASWITGVVLPVDGGRLLTGGEPRDLLGRYEDLV